MIINSNQIKSQFSPVLQKLIDDVLAKSEGSRPFEFGDAKEYQNIHSRPFKTEEVACLDDNDKCFIILINMKYFESITTKKELGIAHELGHLWLLLHGFPREKLCTDTHKQEVYNNCFGPLLEIMEHAIFYPWLKNKYNIDLYEVENQRLADFIRTKLPKRKCNSDDDRVSLIMNYIKFKLQSDKSYWQDKLHKAYKTKFVDIEEVSEKSLHIIMDIINKTPDHKYFIEKYREVLEVIGIKREIWPDFVR